MSCLKSQEMRTLAPELDPLRIGTGWKPEDLSKPQILIEVLTETASGKRTFKCLSRRSKKGCCRSRRIWSKILLYRYL
mgnify:CR=1 FL=1